MGSTEKYETLSIALKSLSDRGYPTDFNLLKSHHAQNDPVWMELMENQFRIVEVHRFDGMTNVDDESVLYVIETDKGVKGTLLDAYGVDADPSLTSIIRKMRLDL
ncbi:phosphoribosylpyrophosphate synthetase [Marinilongibacter aquaticus]|uniref:phosphoribosylpyrophosphate synthetase n=1 Tax=Marinilongibacter aquaticus TaxID=2975157 RepID=UPI0021BD13A5|nr:phosphoribosylpyrophosphate synthetase [Marinilongibacter aquaticus]UBM59252.1 phosphoribosylpyrophosphate synthetase [Marinilongibacter aquaticus]